MPRYLHDDLRPILGADPRRGGLPRAGDRDDRAVRRVHATPRPTRPAGRSATSRGWPRPSCGSSRGRWRAATPAGSSRGSGRSSRRSRSFGFCKAHAAAFALPTYQSAWLKAHYPAHFLSGVLTHDPGMYPKRLILDDARQFGIAVLGLDVNAWEKTYVVERRSTATDGATGRLRHPAGAVGGQGDLRGRGGPDRRGPALPVAHRLLAARPGLPAGGGAAGARRAGSTASTASGRRSRCAAAARVTRRDLLLQVADLDRHARAVDRASTGAAGGSRPGAAPGGRVAAVDRAEDAAAATAPTAGPGPAASPAARTRRGASGRAAWDPSGCTRRQQAGSGSRRRASPGRPGRPTPVTSVQLALDLGDAPRSTARSAGCPEMNASERVRAELEILGLDASRHVVEFYDPFLDALGVTRSRGPARAAQPVRAAGRRGQGGHPDPADPVRAPGRLPDPRRRDRPGRRDVLRGRAGALRRHGVPLLAAGRPRRAAPHRPARGLAAGHRLLGAAGCTSLAARRLDAVRSGMAAVPEGFGAAGEGPCRARRGRSTRR